MLCIAEHVLEKKKSKCTSRYFGTLYTCSMNKSYYRMETLNGETITGIALIFLAILFLYASSVNQVWALIRPADFLILAIGGGFLALGIITMKRQKQTVSHA